MLQLKQRKTKIICCHIVTDENSVIQKTNNDRTPTIGEDSKVNQMHSAHTILEHYNTVQDHPIQKPVSLYPGYALPLMWNMHE